ncbi:MAG: glycosyltransferase family 1 protein [Oscillospiraceae bacterium]|nr:glycosyltransferase family 1 protein [Oscillospiraceae bacterium]MBR6982288.1 glycosyltransferase family 1 protein [Ruminococcus sp.]
MKRIVAFAVGSYGDCEPFIELGTEMLHRGYKFTIVSFIDHRKRILNRGIDFLPIHGDLKEMTRRLLSESTGAKNSMYGLKDMLEKSPQLYNDFLRGAKCADLIIYMQFGALAYHFAEAFGIPCVRTMVYPFDVTGAYSSMFPQFTDSPIKSKISYIASDIMMNMISVKTANVYRKKLGLGKWNYLRFYKKMHGKRLLTLYQFSDVLAPKDPAWGERVHLTGPWFCQDHAEYQPDPDLEKFLNSGDKPIFVGFGSMVYSKMEILQKILMKAISNVGMRAVFCSFSTKFKSDSNNENFFFADYVPYDYLFDRVCAVVHHGGCGTTHLGLMHGLPTLVLSFGGDQDFWGDQIHRLGAGPPVIRVNHEKVTVSRLEEAFMKIKSGIYNERAFQLGKKIGKESGVVRAADLLEHELL